MKIYLVKIDDQNMARTFYSTREQAHQYGLDAAKLGKVKFDIYEVEANLIYSSES